MAFLVSFRHLCLSPWSKSTSFREVFSLLNAADINKIKHNTGKEITFTTSQLLGSNLLENFTNFLKKRKVAEWEKIKIDPFFKIQISFTPHQIAFIKPLTLYK